MESSADGGKIPTGREEVTAAILTAAADLFAERGPAATSIRDIAARSKVNHGLVFRHFGVKQKLVGAVLDHLATETIALMDSDVPAEEKAPVLDRHMRVMARTVLDGYPAGQLQTYFPGAAQLLSEARRYHDSDRSARLAVAHAQALKFGWLVFGSFLGSAIGFDITPAELHEAVEAQASRIIQLPQ